MQRPRATHKTSLGIILLVVGVPLALCIVSFTASASREEPTAQEIVRKSVERNQTNWKVTPEYEFTERDVVLHKGKQTMARTFKVLMIDGSPYDELIQENGHSLPRTKMAAEQKKLKRETARRNHETPAARHDRIAAYERDREHEHALMNEMVDAFDFKLTRQEQVNGRTCYVLEATPRAGYQPKSNETKVLTGMRGTMWIDTQEYQWVKVEAEVFRPVPVEHSLADVQPGTEFLLEQKPIGDNVWLPSHFMTRVRATALVLWSKAYKRDEIYSDYHRAESSRISN